MGLHSFQNWKQCIVGSVYFYCVSCHRILWSDSPVWYILGLESDAFDVCFRLVPLCRNDSFAMDKRFSRKSVAYNGDHRFYLHL